jgi:hypothetical protein
MRQQLQLSSRKATDTLSALRLALGAFSNEGRQHTELGNCQRQLLSGCGRSNCWRVIRTAAAKQSCSRMDSRLRCLPGGVSSRPSRDGRAKRHARRVDADHRLGAGGSGSATQVGYTGRCQDPKKPGAAIRSAAGARYTDARPSLSALAMSLGRRCSAPQPKMRRRIKRFAQAVVLPVSDTEQSFQRLLWADEMADADCPERGQECERAASLIASIAISS